MALPENRMTCISNLWLRQMVFKKAGDANEGHEHNYDHVTLLTTGSVRVHVEGKTSDFVAPQMIYIQKGKVHYIEALEDNTIAFCVHALRNKDTEDIITQDQIPLGIDAFAAGMAKPL
jgi:quercetin dioxygenase-like cupin family protein